MKKLNTVINQRKVRVRRLYHEFVMIILGNFMAILVIFKSKQYLHKVIIRLEEFLRLCH